MIELFAKSKDGMTFLSIFALIFCFGVSSFSQTEEDLKLYSERIEFGEIEVKRNALFELRNYENESASRVAIPALSDPSEIVRATATRSVVYLPVDEAVRVLLPLLNEDSPYLRRETAFALGMVGSPIASAALIRLMEKDKKPEVRTACAAALGKIGDIAAVRPLTKVIQNKRKSKDTFFRRAAARAIGQIAQRIQSRKPTLTTPESFLPDKYKVINRAKYSKLIEAFPDFGPANNLLIGILTNRKESDDVRREAAFAIGEIGDASSIKPLELNLKSPDYYLSEICEEALKKVYSIVNFANSDDVPNHPSDKN